MVAEGTTEVTVLKYFVLVTVAVPAPRLRVSVIAVPLASVPVMVAVVPE